jgi:hypothetical protein
VFLPASAAVRIQFSLRVSLGFVFLPSPVGAPPRAKARTVLSLRFSICQQSTRGSAILFASVCRFRLVSPFHLLHGSAEDVLAFAPPLAWGSWFFLHTLGFSAALRRRSVSFLLKSCYSCAVPSSPASAPPWRFCFLPRRAATRVRSSISLVEARRRALAVLPCFLPQPSCNFSSHSGSAPPAGFRAGLPSFRILRRRRCVCSSVRFGSSCLGWLGRQIFRLQLLFSLPAVDLAWSPVLLAEVTSLPEMCVCPCEC